MASPPNCHQKTPEGKTYLATRPPDHRSLSRSMGMLGESVNPLILHANVCKNINVQICLDRQGAFTVFSSGPMTLKSKYSLL